MGKNWLVLEKLNRIIGILLKYSRGFVFFHFCTVMISQLSDFSPLLNCSFYSF